MQIARTWACVAFSALTLLFAGVSYRYAWLSGCVFDSKSGTGDFAQSQHYSLVVLCASVFAIASAVLAAHFPLRHNRALFAGTSLFLTALGIPALFLLAMAAEATGASACGP